MTVKFTARRTAECEPILTEHAVPQTAFSSVITESGKLFPAQAKDGRILIVADAEGGREISAELSDRKADGGVEVKYAEDGKALDVFINGKLFTSYVFDRGFLKPFLGPVYTSDGSTYTRPDLNAEEHPHQRSVFFGIGDVNGIDFWNEHKEERGEERHSAIENIVSGPAWGGFTAKNVWCDYKGHPVMDEKRTFTFYNQTEKCRYVDAEITFTASYGKVVFGPTKEAGPLGIRINEEMRADRTGSFINSYGGKNEDECWGRSACWCDYSGTVDGRKYGIAVFDNEDNERYPTAWHIRNYGLFAANNLYFKGGFDIPHHFSITYKYRICFYENELNTADRFLNYAK